MRKSTSLPERTPRFGAPDFGGVRGERIVGGVRTPAAAAPDHPAPAPPNAPKPLQPVQDTAAPIFDTISNPGTTAGLVADRTQAVTDGAGGSVARVSPQAGGTVTDTGQTTADAVRQLPLPDHVLPGY